MKKIQDILISTRTMAVLLLVYAASMGYATFLENDYGTPTAKALIYEAKWFELIMLLLMLNFVGNISRYRLWRREKWPVLVFHLSFILIFLGGAVTRYISFEGIMHIREGETSNEIITDKNFFKIQIEEKGDVLNYEDIPYLMSPLHKNFKATYQFHDNKISVKALDYIQRKKDSIVLNPAGTEYLHLVSTGQSGRENIYINATILGLPRAQIDALIGDIIAFADIGDYIEQPVKTYSSGMALRLAFSVQVHVEPDILIVDEALAVGDAAFQAKALARIDEILARGTTLLFVGHDLNAVRAFCHRAMLLEKGRIVDSGLPDDVVVAYMQRNQDRILQEQRKSNAFALKKLADGYGVEDACVVACTLNGQRHLGMRHGERVELEFQVRLRPDVGAPGLTIDIVDAKGLQISGRRISLPRVSEVGTVAVSVGFAATLQQGLYRLRLRVVDAPRLEQTTILSRQDGHLSFEIVDDCRDRFTGMFPLPMDVQVGT